MTSPRVNDTLTGTATVTGYACVPAGKVPDGFLLVDGDVYDTIKYGLPSPTACATLPDIAACPNIGFSATFDSTRILNGPHIFGVYHHRRGRQHRYTPKAKFRNQHLHPELRGPRG
jgi:hypothetical protein